MLKSFYSGIPLLEAVNWVLPGYTESCCDDDTLDEKSTTYTRPLTVHGPCPRWYIWFLWFLHCKWHQVTKWPFIAKKGLGLWLSVVEEVCTRLDASWSHARGMGQQAHFDVWSCNRHLKDADVCIPWLQCWLRLMLSNLHKFAIKSLSWEAPEGYNRVQRSTSISQPSAIHQPSQWFFRGFNVLSFGPGSGPAGQVFEELWAA